MVLLYTCPLHVGCVLVLVCVPLLLSLYSVLFVFLFVCILYVYFLLFDKIICFFGFFMPCVIRDMGLRSKTNSSLVLNLRAVIMRL